MKATSPAPFLLADIFGWPITAHSPSRILGMMAEESKTGEIGTGSDQGANLRHDNFFFLHLIVCLLLNVQALPLLRR